jgi:hypothetical protein
MEDPFRTLINARPNSTTTTPNRDIDFILTFGIEASNISTLSSNTPAHSDHLGIVIDFNMSAHFSSTYLDVSTISSRLLSSGNNSSVSSYIDYVTTQVTNHKLDKKIYELLQRTIQDPDSFTTDDATLLNSIDCHLTDIMLAGERNSTCRRNQRQSWSPRQHEIAKTFSYWKQKSIMESKKLFIWDHLNQLRLHTNISDYDHSNIDPKFIHDKKREARAKWKACKKHSESMSLQFL